MRYVLMLFMFFLSSCAVLGTWQLEDPDNVIEEAIEEFIADKFDIPVDLTPITGKDKEVDYNLLQF